MTLRLVWEYLGNFNDAEAARVALLLMFVIGTPLIIGVTAKLWVWAIRQLHAAYLALQQPEVTWQKLDR